MKKKKVITKLKETSTLIYNTNTIKVSRELDGELFFEIKKELTSDMSEAIAIVMNLGIIDSKFWEIEFDININNISPDKTLYWLSGGDKEWVSRQNYIKSWSEVYLVYQKEFGLTIINSISKSKKFGDIKNDFIKKLNLPILYEFSLEKGFIK